jgi:hypothetical protein
VLDVKFVLKAGATAAFDRDAQFCAFALGLEDFTNAAGGPLADGDGCGHGRSPVRRHTQFIWYAVSDIVKCGDERNQMDKD